MSLASPNEWSEWSEWLAAGLHARNRWRLPVLLMGILFAHGRRTVTTWLRAAGVSANYQDYYYFLAALGRKTESVATQLFSASAAIAPARAAAAGHRRLAHQTLRAEGRRGRHPSQSHARPGRPEVSVRTHLGHAVAGAAASAVGRDGLAVAGHAVRPPTNDSSIPKYRGWRFATKLELAARLVEWIAPLLKQAGKRCGSSSMAATPSGLF